MSRIPKSVRHSYKKYKELTNKFLSLLYEAIGKPRGQSVDDIFNHVEASYPQMKVSMEVSHEMIRTLDDALKLRQKVGAWYATQFAPHAQCCEDHEYFNKLLSKIRSILSSHFETLETCQVPDCVSHVESSVILPIAIETKCRFEPLLGLEDPSLGVLPNDTETIEDNADRGKETTEAADTGEKRDDFRDPMFEITRLFDDLQQIILWATNKWKLYAQDVCDLVTAALGTQAALVQVQRLVQEFSLSNPSVNPFIGGLIGTVFTNALLEESNHIPVRDSQSELAERELSEKMRRLECAMAGAEPSYLAKLEDWTFRPTSILIEWCLENVDRNGPYPSKEHEIVSKYLRKVGAGPLPRDLLTLHARRLAPTKVSLVAVAGCRILLNLHGIPGVMDLASKDLEYATGVFDAKSKDPMLLWFQDAAIRSALKMNPMLAGLAIFEVYAKLTSNSLRLANEKFSIMYAMHATHCLNCVPGKEYRWPDLDTWEQICGTDQFFIGEKPAANNCQLHLGRACGLKVAAMQRMTEQELKSRVCSLLSGSQSLERAKKMSPGRTLLKLYGRLETTKENDPIDWSGVLLFDATSIISNLDEFCSTARREVPVMFFRSGGLHGRAEQFCKELPHRRGDLEDKGMERRMPSTSPLHLVVDSQGVRLTYSDIRVDGVGCMSRPSLHFPIHGLAGLVV